MADNFKMHYAAVDVLRRLLVKNAFNELRRFAHPKYVRSLKLDGKVVSEPVVRSVTVYFSVIIGIIIVSIILVSANGFDFESSLSAVFACIFNKSFNIGEWVAEKNSDFVRK